MDEQDAIWWDNFRNTHGNTISGEEVRKISALHAKYFNHKYVKLCTCSPKMAQQYINDLNEFYLEN